MVSFFLGKYLRVELSSNSLNTIQGKDLSGQRPKLCMALVTSQYSSFTPPPPALLFTLWTLALCTCSSLCQKPSFPTHPSDLTSICSLASKPLWLNLFSLESETKLNNGEWLASEDLIIFSSICSQNWREEWSRFSHYYHLALYLDALFCCLKAFNGPG